MFLSGSNLIAPLACAGARLRPSAILSGHENTNSLAPRSLIARLAAELRPRARVRRLYAHGGPSVAPGLAVSV